MSEVPGSPGVRSPVDRLRAAGMRVTPARLAVLQELPVGVHRSVDEIATAVRRTLGAVSLQAVYNVLDALAGAGLVRRIEPLGHPARYESRVSDNHHHLVCRVCGAIADVDCAVGVVPCLSPADAAGYLVDEAEVTYWGLCPQCQNHRRPSADHGGTTAGPTEKHHVPARSEGGDR